MKMEKKQFEIGYMPRKEYIDKNGIKTIKEIRLVEISEAPKSFRLDWQKSIQQIGCLILVIGIVLLCLTGCAIMTL